MKRFLRLLKPDRIGTQILLLVVLSLAVAHVVMAASFLLFEPQLPAPGERFGTIEHLRFLVRMIDAEPDARTRASLIETAKRADPGLQTLQSPLPPATGAHLGRLPHALAEWSNDGTVFYVAQQAAGDVARPPLIVARLTDGTILAAPLPLPPASIRLLSPAAIVTLAFLASAVAVLSLWAAWQLAAPLARFVETAQQFTSDTSGIPLVESGPLEIRRATRALNDMQARVVKLIADRTHMLAAISHDLRTPITRLRLRAEEIENPRLKEQIIHDLSATQSLIGSALTYLRGQLDPPQRVKIDLPPLVQTVCDGFAGFEERIGFVGPPHLYAMCEPDQLMRAIENLIDNGLKFGTTVNVTVAQQDGQAVFDVHDDGPGIPDAEKVRATEPFYRGDAARGLSDSFGLGLSIARGVVERNGGSLELLDGTPSGLLARIRLPLGN